MWAGPNGPAAGYLLLHSAPHFIFFLLAHRLHLLLSAQLFSAVAGQAPPASVAAGAALAAAVADVAEAFAVAGRGALAAAGVVAAVASAVAVEAAAVVASVVVAAEAAHGVVAVYATAQSAVAGDEFAQLVLFGVAVARPSVVVAAVAAVYATAQSAVAGDESAQLVLFGVAVARPVVAVQVASVALVYATAQPVVADGEFAQLVLFGGAVGRLALVVSVQVASVALVAANVSVQPVVVAEESVLFSARSALDGLAQDVGVQSVFGGLPFARLTFQVAFFFPVAVGVVPPVFLAGLPRLFPAPPVFVCPVRWIADSPGSAVVRVSPTYLPVRPPVFFPVP